MFCKYIPNTETEMTATASVQEKLKDTSLVVSDEIIKYECFNFYLDKTIQSDSVHIFGIFAHCFVLAK